MEQTALDAAWLRHQQHGDLESRNQLVLHYISLVRVVAIKIAAGLPRMVDREDLVSYGIFGLLDALDKYDHTKGVKFETYAVTRIKGSILDEIRSLDWVPRTIRAKARDVERAEAELHAQLGRPSEDAELAAHLGISIADLWTLQSQARATQVSPLEDQDDDRPSVGSFTFDPGANPEDLYVSNEITDLLASAIESMPQRSKTILVLYYFQEMTLAEIGKILGVTESRVCQLQSKLLQTLHITLSSQGLESVAA